MPDSGFVGSVLRARCELCIDEMWEGEQSLADARKHQRKTGASDLGRAHHGVPIRLADRWEHPLMDQNDTDRIAEKLTEIHRLIDETFGLRDGLAAIIVLDEVTASIYGMDCTDPDAQREFNPVLDREDEIGSGYNGLGPRTKHWVLRLVNRSKALADGTHMMGCNVRTWEKEA